MARHSAPSSWGLHTERVPRSARAGCDTCRNAADAARLALRNTADRLLLLLAGADTASSDDAAAFVVCCCCRPVLATTTVDAGPHLRVARRCCCCTRADREATACCIVRSVDAILRQLILILFLSGCRVTNVSQGMLEAQLLQAVVLFVYLLSTRVM